MTLKKYEGDVNDFINSMAIALEEGSVDPDVRRLAEYAVVSFNPTFHVRAVFNFVRQTFPYLADPVDAELLQHPRIISQDYLNQGRARGLDCDCVAVLEAAMLSSIGIRSRVAIMDTAQKGSYDHAVCQVFSSTLGNIWLNADTTTNYPFGWELNHGMITYIGEN